LTKNNILVCPRQEIKHKEQKNSTVALPTGIAFANFFLNEQRGKVKSYLLTNHNQESKVILLLVNEEEKGRQKEILFICLSYLILFFGTKRKE
jgi:hypothetical protein